MTHHEQIEVRIAEAVAAVRRGWCLLPLRGKRPISTGWPELPPMSEREAAAHARTENLGINCHRSGLLVIDIDSSRGATFSVGAQTWRVRTGSGGEHVIFAMPEPPLGNSSNRIAPHVDTRGRGGQIVCVGGVHPDSGESYRWIVTPDECPLAPLPHELGQRLRPAQPQSIAPQRAAQNVLHATDRFIEAAWRNELDALAYAAPGGRGTQLNRAAFALGRFVARGYIAEGDLVSALLSACAHNGLLEHDGEPNCLRIIRAAIEASRARASA